jgi:hypothetical protein
MAWNKWVLLTFSTLNWPECSSVNKTLAKNCTGLWRWDGDAFDFARLLEYQSYRYAQSYDWGHIFYCI